MKARGPSLSKIFLSSRVQVCSKLFKAAGDNTTLCIQHVCCLHELLVRFKGGAAY